MDHLSPDACSHRCAADPQPSPSIPVVISNLETLPSAAADRTYPGALSFTIPMRESLPAPSWQELLGQR
jgi:hypothetical protein